MRKLFLIILFCFVIFFQACSSRDIQTISFATWGSQSEINIIKSIIDDFEAQTPSVKVNLIHIPDNYFQKLHLLIASNLAPDVIFINNINAKMYVDANKIEPLNTYIAKSSSLNQFDFFTSALNSVTYDENIYLIPRDISNLVVYYNKNLFDKYNIKYPASNWTINDFLDIAKKMSIDIDGDENIDIYGFGFEEKSLYYLPFLWSNGGGILKNSKKLLINDKNTRQALQFYADLRNKYNVSPDADVQASLTTSQLFLQEKIAMHLCGRWCSLTYKNNASFDWDITKFPTGINGSRVATDVSGWAISSESKNKKLAWKFIEFLTSDVAISKITLTGLILPAKKNIAYSDIFLDYPPQNSLIFIEAITDSVTTPVCVNYSEVNDILDEEFEYLFNGKKHVDDIIDNRLIEKLERLLD